MNPKYEDLSDPFLLPDMDKAVERLARAASSGEKVLIYGDYDVDGVTASAIMREALKFIGVSAEVMLPDRFIDGYGMSERLVKRAAKDEISLVITVDCGSNNGEIVDKLAVLGVDVIVTDHHEISDTIPEKAVAVVNPKRKEADLGDLRELCGAGVAFFVARALVLRGKIPEGQEKWMLDLAAIGTICDSMKLVGDNRIICHYGLIVLEKTRRVGLTEMMKKAGTKTLNTDAIGFQIGPRLNAAGRMDTADKAFSLVTVRSKTQAAALAKELNDLNMERKNQQEAAVNDVAKTGVGDEPVIVAKGPWHEGILGIIAGRLSEHFQRPAFALTEVEDGFKGSGRSFGDFNLSDALNACRDDLESGGGHAAACGLKVKNGHLEAFKRNINEYYRGLGLTGQEKYLLKTEDLEVDTFSDFTLEFVDELSSLEPFGEGNPEPVFLLKGATVISTRRMGKKENHLGMVVRDKLGVDMRLLAFFARKEWLEIEGGSKIDVWLSVTKNEFNGSVNVEGRILRIEEQG